MRIKAVIFDLDGVLLSTDKFHYSAWKALAEREKIHFDSNLNDRLRGIGRMESLEIILSASGRHYSDSEKLEMAEFKNTLYKKFLDKLTPDDIFPGVYEFISSLTQQRIKVAIASSSKNARYILEKTGLLKLFKNAVVDGNSISKSKPNPEVFIKAAKLLKTPPQYCMVIEDSIAGIDAAKAAGMTALGIGHAATYELCDYSAQNIADINLQLLLS